MRLDGKTFSSMFSSIISPNIPAVFTLLNIPCIFLTPSFNVFNSLICCLTLSIWSATGLNALSKLLLIDVCIFSSTICFISAVSLMFFSWLLYICAFILSSLVSSSFINVSWVRLPISVISLSSLFIWSWLALSFNDSISCCAFRASSIFCVCSCDSAMLSLFFFFAIEIANPAETPINNITTITNTIINIVFVSIFIPPAILNTSS